MKSKPLFYLFLTLVSGQGFFSCTSARFAATTSEPAPALAAGEWYPEEAEAANMAQTHNRTSLFDDEEDAGDILEASAVNDPALPAGDTYLSRRTAEAAPNIRRAPVSSPSVREALKATKQHLQANKESNREIKQQFTKAERKEMRRSIKQALQTSDTQLLAIIFAILIPPLGVYLYEGEITTRFWISLVLTLLFFFPGMIYSLLVVTGVI